MWLYCILRDTLLTLSFSSLAGKGWRGKRKIRITWNQYQSWKIPVCFPELPQHQHPAYCCGTWRYLTHHLEWYSSVWRWKDWLFLLYGKQNIISFRNYTTQNIYLVTNTRETGGGPTKGNWDDQCPSTPDLPREAEGTGLVQFGEEAKSELIAAWNYLKRNDRHNGDKPS